MINGNKIEKEAHDSIISRIKKSWGIDGRENIDGILNLITKTSKTIQKKHRMYHLSLILNGWHTSMRNIDFKSSEDLRCPLCKDAVDSVQHMSGPTIEHSCPTVREAAILCNLHEDGPITREKFLGLDLPSEVSNEEWIIFTNAVYRTHVEIKFNNKKYEVSDIPHIIYTWFDYLTSKATRTQKKTKDKQEKPPPAIESYDDVVVFWKDQFHRIKKISEETVYLMTPKGKEITAPLNQIKDALKRKDIPIHVYTDGSFQKANRENNIIAKSSWGGIILGLSPFPTVIYGPVETNPQGEMPFKSHTNNSGELSAIYHLSKAILENNPETNRSILFRPDSTLAINAADGKWATKSHRKPLEKIRPLIKSLHKNYNFSFQHIYSHTGWFWNDLADEAADHGMLVERPVLKKLGKSIIRNVHEVLEKCRKNRTILENNQPPLGQIFRADTHIDTSLITQDRKRKFVKNPFGLIEQQEKKRKTEYIFFSQNQT